MLGIRIRLPTLGNTSQRYPTKQNLRNEDRGWLIFGVSNTSRTVVGSTYRVEKDRLNGLKHQIASDTEPGVTFREIHVLEADRGRVVLFEIPAAPMGIPIAWKGHYYARAGESLTHLGLDKLDEIRNQTLRTDWSAGLVENASLAQLDQAAVSRARENFTRKYANRFAEGEVAGWPDAVFLDRARIPIDGRITRTALLLLGRVESAHHLSPHPAQMTWRLEDLSAHTSTSVHRSC
jgi:ATP-dependent DNA helicase RecG